VAETMTDDWGPSGLLMSS